MCEFVRLVKGVDYIERVQEITRRAQNLNNDVSVMTIDEAMLTEPVETALSLGINAEKVRSATEKKVLETGRPYDTIDELLEAVFNDQDNCNSCFPTSGVSHQSTVLNTNSADDPSISSNDSLNCDATVAASSSASTEKNLTKTTSAEIKSNQIQNNTPNSNEASTADRQYLEEENRKLKDARLCKVCLDEEVGVVYLPCGHLGKFSKYY